MYQTFHIEKNHKKEAYIFAKTYHKNLYNWSIERTNEQKKIDLYFGKLSEICFRELNKDKEGFEENISEGKPDGGFDFKINNFNYDVKYIQLGSKTKTLIQKNLKSHYYSFFTYNLNLDEMYYLGDIKKSELIHFLNDSKYNIKEKFFVISNVFPDYKDLIK